MARQASKHINIVVRGVVFPDAVVAAKALGVTAAHVRSMAQLGRLDTIGAKSLRIPVEIRGVHYPSFTAAGAALGVRTSTVRQAWLKGTLHRVGTGRTGVEPMCVRISGRNFDDVRAAAAYYGLTPASVYSAIADGDPDRIGREKRYNPWKSRPYRIGTLTFPSMRAASRALGFKNPEFIAKAEGRKSRRGRERILAAAMQYASRVAAE